MNGLVVSTAVRVVNRVHGHTGDVRVELTTGLGLVVSSTSGSNRHLVTAMTTEHADGCTAVGREFLQSTRGHPDADRGAHPGFNHAGVPAGASDLATVTGSEFEVVDRRSFRDVPDFGDVSRAQGDVVADGHFAANGKPFSGGHERGVAIRGLDPSERCGVNRAVD